MAAHMWNDCRPSAPPVASCSYGCYEIDEVDVYNLKLALQVIQTSNSLGMRLSSEQYTLNRLLYKSNNQQRRWRWYQMLNKIQKCLSRLQANHPATFIADAIGCCQINREQNASESTIHLPSRQMLEFVLVKLMGQAKLCAYILNMAESVYIFVVQNITSGQFLAHNVIYASVASRIWVMMRVMLRDILSWYSTLQPWLEKLKGTSMQWLPAGETLPESLYDCLREDYDPTKYAKAIKRTSKTKKGSSLLDTMFAASQTTPNTIATESLSNNDLNNKESTVTASAEPSMDLGEPVTAEEVAEKRSNVKLKRKQSESGSQEEPSVKKLRTGLESSAPDAAGARQRTDPSVARSDDIKEDLRSFYEFKRQRGVKTRIIKTKPSAAHTKQCHEGVLEFLKRRLKEKECEMQEEGVSETTKGTVFSSSDETSRPKGRNWKKHLKKKLKNKLEKLTKISEGRGKKSEKQPMDNLMMEVQHSPGEQEGAASLAPSEISHPETNVKLKRKTEVAKKMKKSVTKNEERQPNSFRKECKEDRKVQMEEFHKPTKQKKTKKEADQKRSKKKEHVLEISDEQSGPSTLSTTQPLEIQANVRPSPTETSHGATKKKLKKKLKVAKDTKKSFSGTSQDIEGTGKKEKKKDKTGRFMKLKKWKKPVDKSTLKEKSGRSPCQQNGQDSLAVMHHQDKPKQAKKKLKKLHKLKSKSSLVCDLGEIAQGAPRPSSIQESDIDDIFACLE